MPTKLLCMLSIHIGIVVYDLDVYNYRTVITQIFLKVVLRCITDHRKIIQKKLYK